VDAEGKVVGMNSGVFGVQFSQATDAKEFKEFDT
jgi:hypothetical protein